MKKRGKSLVYILAIVYSTIIGLSFMFGKIGLQYSAPLDLLAYRFTAAFIAVLISCLLGSMKLDINLDMIKKILPMALFYPLLYFGFQAFGLNYSQSSEAGILLAAGPAITMILASYFLNEKTSLLQKLSIAISVLGVIYITVKKSNSVEITNIKGSILLIISVLSFSIYNVMARRLARDFSPMELSFVMISISFISFNALAIGNHLVSGSIGSFFTPLKYPEFIMAILYIGVLSTFVTSYLSNYILSKIEASKMSIFTNLSTVISIGAGVVIMDESVFYYHIIGSIMIIAGVIGVNFFDS